MTPETKVHSYVWTFTDKTDLSDNHKLFSCNTFNLGLGLLQVFAEKPHMDTSKV